MPCTKENNELKFVIFPLKNELQFVSPLPGHMDVCEWDDTTGWGWVGYGWVFQIFSPWVVGPLPSRLLHL